jgi:Fe-S-cluster-containing dehydrogenase component
MSEVRGEHKMTFETRSCTGCTTCEIACSYHHSEAFQPSISSIEITGSPKDGFKVSFYSIAGGGHRSCDGCFGLAEPLCVTYCPAVAKSELKELLNRSNEG